MLRRFPSESGSARIIVITTGGTIVQKFDCDLGVMFQRPVEKNWSSLLEAK